jgi:hypothetical protein
MWYRNSPAPMLGYGGAVHDCSVEKEADRREKILSHGPHPC